MRAALLVLVLVAGCAQPAYWEPVPGWQWNGEHRLVVTDFEMFSFAGGPEHTCYASRNKDGSCTIYCARKKFATADQKCVMEHELKHCAGWDHPQYRYSMGCTPALQHFRMY